jgi:hypothetical protein
MNGLQLFLTRYVRTTDLVREMFADLSDTQIRTPPRRGVNTLAWLAWHVARVEDVGVNRLVVDDEQLFVRGGWATRLKVARYDFGTGMTPAEVDDLSASIDVRQLLDYSGAHP